MSCIQARSDGALESYLLGRLNDVEEEEFDIHLLECTECQQALEELVLLRDALASKSTSAAPDIVKPQLGRNRVWMGIAAVLILGLGISFWYGRSTNQPDPALLAELAEIAPPAYAAPPLRSSGAPAEQQFRQGMERYSAGDYDGAISYLEASAEQDPHPSLASLYLGVCYLATDRAESASDKLQLAAQDPLTEERARFYLAKAHLQLGELDAASRELGRVIDLEGDLESDAGVLLRRVVDLNESPD